MVARTASLVTLCLLVVFASGPAWADRASGAGEATRLTQAQMTRSGQVYLLRGLMNVFSLGMDALGGKLQAHGVRAEVYNHASWSSLAQSVAQSHNAGQQSDPIIIVGHSLGADAAILMAKKLGDEKVPVSLVVTFDPVNHGQAPGNVRRFINFYQSDNGWGHEVSAGPGFRGQLVNEDLRGQTQIGHTSIDKAAELHDSVIKEVLRVTRPVRRSRSAS